MLVIKLTQVNIQNQKSSLAAYAVGHKGADLQDVALALY